MEANETRNERLSERGLIPFHGAVAQLGERCNGIAEVAGSRPVRSTYLLRRYTMKEDIWYEMLITLQGKQGLLVDGEIYQEEEIIAEGFSVQELVETNQMILFQE